MKSVLYTFDMEPITVIELPMGVHRFKFHRYTVPVMEPPRCTPMNGPIIPESFRTVDLYVEKLRFRGKEYPMFFVNEKDLVNSFDLRCVPLVGQLREWERQYKKGFMMGLLAAVTGGIHGD